ncbi:hypothetical protein GS455_12560 [Rhodococcus hoagii]|nr:hypothetical protein [Prescottella equi]
MSEPGLEQLLQVLGECVAAALGVEREVLVRLPDRVHELAASGEGGACVLADLLGEGGEVGRGEVIVDVLPRPRGPAADGVGPHLTLGQRLEAQRGAAAVVADQRLGGR